MSKISLQCHIALFYLDDVSQSTTPATIPTRKTTLKTTPEFDHLSFAETTARTPITTVRTTKKPSKFCYKLSHHFIILLLWITVVINQTTKKYFFHLHSFLKALLGPRKTEHTTPAIQDVNNFPTMSNCFILSR